MTEAQLIIEELAESYELECKLAGGRDGSGKLPNDFWSSYSAFANTHGGTVLLGVKEKPRGKFQVEGIADPERIITELFNNLNNTQKVSGNVITDHDVNVRNIDGKKIIEIKVRRASRQEKPIHLGSSPFNGNSYRRLHEGDRKMDDESVRRLIAERIEDERDSVILQGFGMDDIDSRSLKIYRQMLRDAKSAGHPFLAEDDKGLLTKIRGWRKDRQTGEEGLTLAGVLMFGTWDAIQEAAPHYFVDYQEQPVVKTEGRWIDRVYPDGTWSGNLFDFYRIVYRKLTDPEILKIPFRLKKGQRQDDTPVHEAIREALVNTIVHADYSGRVSVLVVKRPDMMGFRNPGDMRIPVDRAVKGGESDCRNRIMHQIFLMIGLGERAGSGVPKIYRGWNWRHWRAPSLSEIVDPPQTLLELRMLELMPEGVLDQLQAQLGEQFNSLPHLERLITATAATEQVVSHKRITEISTDHGHDVTLALGNLVRQQLLKVSGYGRGATYSLSGHNLPTPEQVFGETILFDLASCPEDLTSSSEGLDELGRLLTTLLTAPVVYDLDRLQPDFREKLEAKAEKPRTKKRLPKDAMREVLLSLCEDQFITRLCLAQLVDRGSDFIRQQYLTELVDEGKLRLAFPQSPTDNRQAYIAHNGKVL